MFIRLERVPACDRQTDGRTERQTDGIAVGITALCIASNAASLQKYLLKWNTKYMYIFGYLSTFPNTFVGDVIWYFKYHTPNTFCVCKYNNYHDKNTTNWLCHFIFTDIDIGRVYHIISTTITKIKITSSAWFVALKRFVKYFET